KGRTWRSSAMSYSAVVLNGQSTQNRARKKSPATKFSSEPEYLNPDGRELSGLRSSLLSNPESRLSSNDVRLAAIARIAGPAPRRNDRPRHGDQRLWAPR